MKIDIGESLIYSWLRHVKECQIVQNNWKASQHWEIKNYDQLNDCMSVVRNHFDSKHKLSIFKGTKSVDQLLKQAEIDALGISISDNIKTIHCVDIAFHEAQLNYGSTEETICRIIKKSIRSALCAVAYLDVNEAEIIFASPKANVQISAKIHDMFNEIESLLNEFNWHFSFKAFFNNDFKLHIISTVKESSINISDTNELFVRSLQLLNMFDYDEKEDLQVILKNSNSDEYQEMKIGVIVRSVLRKILSETQLPIDEIELLQTGEYSRQQFHIQYPLLKKQTGDSKKPERYYSSPLNINNNNYYLCSEWYETAANNDRPYLLNWIRNHTHQSNK